MKEKLTLGISPCPNDTYIFSALLMGKVKPEIPVNPYIADVEELNKKTAKKELDISKISVFAYLSAWRDYVLLNCGGAIGKGCGPILVARRDLTPEEIQKATVAIPGKMTTAHFLLEYLNLHKGRRIEMIFHEVMPSVVSGKVDAGVVIHEGRWTYGQYGLTMVKDLGKYWEETTGLPLPLGVIAVKRSFAPEIAPLFENSIRASIDFARRCPDEVKPFIKNHAQEMDDLIIDKHIEAFVTPFTVDLGAEGKEAIKHLIFSACRCFNIEPPNIPIFWDE
ncbi:MAG: 1,4-dihydroxy-6-naphthoate synthase [Deltaproteobacteria bacterium]|nr:1,4-dihydroxy-6-naphthoate synthase [Deltaproteobacteria bacterium]MBW2067857.1 1,4-dihydroxy-6-naphthoate synthase [Deltaproteobacteria bacterium]